MVPFCALKGVHWRLRVLLRFRNSEERRNSSEIDDLIEANPGVITNANGSNSTGFLKRTGESSRAALVRCIFGGGEL